MSLKPKPFPVLPESTARVARRVCSAKNPYLILGDQVGTLFADEAFQDWYAVEGAPGLSPAQLALVVIFQVWENLSDREAAEAVRVRIDWKYALHLELEDKGFNFSVLSDFRRRLVNHQGGAHLLQTILERLRALHLLKERSCQRTDSAAVLSAARSLNRLEMVMETLRLALEEVAERAPDWLRGIAQPEWSSRYALAWRGSRIPKEQAEREALARTVGEDGGRLLQALEQEGAPPGWQQWDSIQLLAEVWRQQYEQDHTGWHWRPAAALPAAADLIWTPNDPEARCTARKSGAWLGYTLHVTETCEPDQPRLITDVQMTPAPQADVEVVTTIHRDLRQRNCLPGDHLGDAGYMAAHLVVNSKTHYGVHLQGPMPGDQSWQARSKGFTAEQFVIDIEKQVATCPQGHPSSGWSNSQTSSGREVIHIAFPRSLCQRCEARPQCTRSAHQARTLQVSPHFATLVAARREQTTDAFHTLYARRAGIEGTLSEALLAHDLRRSRYIGMAKTWLRAWLVAAAINLERATRWLIGDRPSQTRVPHLQTLLSPVGG